MKHSFLMLCLAALLLAHSSSAQITKRRTPLTLSPTGDSTVPKTSGKSGNVFNAINTSANNTPLQLMLNTQSKKVGKFTTLTITKRTPDWKARPANNAIVTASDAAVSPENVQQVCRTETHRYTAENMNQDIMNPDAVGLIKLGAVYSLENMQSGNYNIINVNRAPVNVSIENAAQNAIIVTDPTADNLQSALDKLRNIPYPVTPSAISQYMETTQVTSAESLDMAAGLSYSGFGFNASNVFNYNSSSTTNKFLLTYTSANYTAYAHPQSNGVLFTDAAQAKDFTPVYISQVVYGTKLLVFFEANTSQDELKNKFTTSYSGLIGKVTGNLDVDVKNRLVKTTFKIYLFGDGSPLQVVTGYDEMIVKVNDLLRSVSIQGKTYPIQMGKPISHQLKYMDGDIAVTSCKVDEIPQTICGPNPDMPLDLKLALDKYVHGGYGIDGSLTASLIFNDKEFWSKDLYHVPSQARIGTRDANLLGPVAELTIPNVSKEVRDSGFLRLKGIWNSNGDYYMSGIDLTTGPFLKNIFYRDIPLKDILATKPGETFTTTMQFKETRHSPETVFYPTISAKFQYQ